MAAVSAELVSLVTFLCLAGHGAETSTEAQPSEPSIPDGFV